MLLLDPKWLLCVTRQAFLTTFGPRGVRTHLQLHMHTAGESLFGHLLDGVSGQTVAVTPVLRGLDEFTLQGNFQL